MSKNLVEVYQSATGRPLRRSDLSRHPLLHNELATLGLALQEHYRTYEIPKKTKFELRPSISTGYEVSRSTGLHYVFGKEHFGGTFEYKFDPLTQGKMVDSIKTYLLYCHSIVIQDPLPYLLDYFRYNQEGDHSVNRLPATNALLCEYADLAELIQSNIIIPVSEPTIPPGKVPSLPALWRDKITSKLSMLRPQYVHLMAQKVLEEQYRRRYFNDQIDMFFPKTDYVFVLRELLKLSEQKFESRKITEPFGLAVLGSIATVNSSLLTTQDILRIRSNDSAFDEWRSFLGNVFREIYSQDHDHISLSDEFMHTIRDEFSGQRNKFASKVQKGSLRDALKGSGKGIGIGVMTGAVTWVLTNDPTASWVAATASGGIKPIIELLANISEAATNKPTAKTFQHHFMAVGLEPDELPK